MRADSSVQVGIRRNIKRKHAEKLFKVAGAVNWSLQMYKVNVTLKKKYVHSVDRIAT